jgi:alkylhydroperoxidase family enzyme
VALLPYGDEVRNDPEFQIVWREVLEKRAGTVPNLYRMLLHSPTVGQSWLRLGTSIRWESMLCPSYLEMLICYVGKRLHSAYELAQHVPLAVEAGWPESLVRNVDDIDALRRVDSDLADLLEYAGGVLDRRPSVARLSRVRELFGDSQVAEVTAIVAYYSSVALFLEALNIDIEPELL